MNEALAFAQCGQTLYRIAFGILQLNKYETDPYFLKNFQSNTTVCLIIHALCKVYEREIVLF